MPLFKDLINSISKESSSKSLSPSHSSHSSALLSPSNNPTAISNTPDAFLLSGALKVTVAPQTLQNSRTTTPGVLWYDFSVPSLNSIGFPSFQNTLACGINAKVLVSYPEHLLQDSQGHGKALYFHPVSHHFPPFLSACFGSGGGKFGSGRVM
ncbi:hypothetical protein ABW19_dt0202148 [Dactylella cylindrospora]|nr:hypothetical protein ABW19_dt0202148 [Dactylella cylindrospora]